MPNPGHNNHHFILSVLLIAFVATSCALDAVSDWRRTKESAQQARKAGCDAEAEKQYLLAVKKAELLPKYDSLVLSLMELSDFYLAAGQQEKCRDLLTRAKTIGEKQIAEGKTNKNKWMLLTARSADALANIYRDQGAYSNAETLYGQASKLVHDTENRATESGTTGDTGIMTAEQLKTRIEKDRAAMEDIRTNSDGVFDSMILGHKQIGPNASTEMKRQLDLDLVKFVNIENGPRSEKTEATLLDLLTRCKGLVGVRDVMYRKLFERTILYYSRTNQLDKNQKLLEADVKEFASAENLTQAQAVREPERELDARMLASSLNGLADIYLQKARPSTSVEYRKRALRLRERWGPEDATIIPMRRLAAQAYATLHRPEAAMIELDRGLRLIDKLEANSKQRFWAERAGAMMLIAGLERLQGSFKNSGRLLAEVRAMIDENKDAFPVYMTDVWHESADLAKMMGNRAEQKSYLDKNLDYWEKHKAPDPYYNWLALHDEAIYYYYDKDYTNAEKYFQRCLQLARTSKTMISRDDILGDSLGWLGHSELHLQKIEASEKHLLQALSEFHKREIQLPPTEVSMLVNLGNFYQGTNKFDKAEEYYKRALEMAEKECTETIEPLWTTLTSYGDSQTRKGDLATARDMYDKAKQAAESFAVWPDIIVRAFNNLGTIATFQGDAKAARVYFAKAENVKVTRAVYCPDTIVLPYLMWSHTYWLKNQDGKALVLIDKAKKSFDRSNLRAEDLIFDWDFDVSLRTNRKFPMSHAMALDRVQQTAQIWSTSTVDYIPTCTVKTNSILLSWLGRTADSKKLESLAATNRDTELKKLQLR